jgi:hypothetical protein
MTTSLFIIFIIFLPISFMFSVYFHFSGDQVAQRVLQHPRGHAGDPPGLRGRQRTLSSSAPSEQCFESESTFFHIQFSVSVLLTGSNCENWHVFRILNVFRTDPDLSFRCGFGSVFRDQISIRI